MGLAPGGSERASPRASPAHSARSAPAGTIAGPSAAGGAEREQERRCSRCVQRTRAAQGAGPQRLDWTETLLSALRRPRLSWTGARAAAGKAAETQDFSPVPGAHHTSAAVNARRSPQRGDGTRAARSVRRRRRVLESGGAQDLGTPGGGPEPSPPPRLRGTSFGSIVPARAGGARLRVPPGVVPRPQSSRDPARI